MDGDQTKGCAKSRTVPDFDGIPLEIVFMA